jgi:hypothetical protein
VDKLKNDLNFQQSSYDPCVLWNDGCLIVIYTDDTIITGSNLAKVDATIHKIGELFKITSEDQVNNFIGVNITHTNDGRILLTQPKLIQDILEDLGLNGTTKSKPTPALSSKILQPHLDSPPFNESWHYRSIIGKLNFLEKSTRPDITYAVHQCARFSSNPRYEHGKAIKHIGQYLMGTKEKGIECTPSDEGLVCYVDADFAGNWDKQITPDDNSTARSCTGYLIKYAGMPITWT